MKKQKKPYTVTVEQTGPTNKAVRSSFDVDGLLFVGSDMDKHTTIGIYTGTQPPFAVLQVAIERVCEGKDPGFITQLRGHLNIILSSLEEKALDNGDIDGGVQV